MSIVISVATIFCLACAGMYVLLCRKLLSDVNLPEKDELRSLSPLRYQPLERLLDASEYHRLSSHPAISRKMLRNIRARRVRLFREYLNCLTLDYNRVCKAVKLMMVQSAQDRPDLATLLVRQRLTFTVRLFLAETKLTLHVLGVGSVDTRGLLATLDSMHLEMSSLMDSLPMPAAA